MNGEETQAVRSGQEGVDPTQPEAGHSLGVESDDLTRDTASGRDVGPTGGDSTLADTGSITHVPTAPTMAMSSGRTVPKVPGYEVLAELGRGGMGVVYLARELRLNRPCALKMVLAGAHAAPETLARFLTEAQAVAQLKHPAIVRIHHIGETDGLPFFEMEYVEGGSLDKRLDGTPWAAARAAALVEPIAQGMADAHALGLVHRDLKPGNVLLTPSEDPKVIDFGLAKILGSESGLTRTESVLGSPSYMAPEQAEGKARDVGPSADVYALGAILYELLTGRPPFRGATLLETLDQVKSTEPVPPSRLVPGLPRDIETIVLKCLEKDPGKRYASAASLAEDLGRFRRGEPIQARPVAFWERGWKWAKRRPAIAALVVALHVALAALLGLGVVSHIQVRGALSRETIERTKADAARSLEQAARQRADHERSKADVARVEALAETYRASISEVRALRAARPPGWRDDSLGTVAKLAEMPTARRDVLELRTELVACLGVPDIEQVLNLSGGNTQLNALAFSPDGRLLATLAANQVHLWDLVALRHVTVLTGPQPWSDANQRQTTRALHFLPDGRLLFSTRDEGVAVFDPASGTVAATPYRRDPAQARDIVQDRDARLLVIGWSDGVTEVYDPKDGRLLRQGPSLDNRVTLSPNGEWFAVAPWGKDVRLESVSGTSATVTFDGTAGLGASALTYNPDGSLLAGTMADHSVIVWDVATRREFLVLRGHNEAVQQVAFSPDGSWIATASNDHTARLWDARTGQAIAVLPGAWFVESVTFSPDGEKLAVGVSGNRVSVYSMSGRRVHRRLHGHFYGAQSLAFHPQRPLLASGADDHAVVLWDAPSGRAVQRWSQGHGAYVAALTFSGDGRFLFSGEGVSQGSSTYQLRMRDVATGRLQQSLTGHATGVHALAHDPENNRLASGDERGNVFLWDLNTGTIAARWALGQRWVTSLAFLDGGKRLVAASMGAGVASIDLTGSEAAKLVPVEGGSNLFVVDKRRQGLLLGTQTGSIVRLDLADMRERTRVDQAHAGAVSAAVLSPDGRLLATGGYDRLVVLRDAESFQPLLRFPGWTGVIKGLAFDASGRWLAFVGADADVALWDVQAIREGLAEAGLAFDATSVADARPREASREVIELRPEAVDSQALARARGSLSAGTKAYQEARLDDALRDLPLARDRYRELLRARPADPTLTQGLSIAVGFLASALRDAGRPVEALTAAREAAAVLESLRDKRPIDLYNLACNIAQVVGLSGATGAPMSQEDEKTHLARAVDLIAQAVQSGLGNLAQLDTDHDLDPLRQRADFRALLLDRAFPSDPFEAQAELAELGNQPTGRYPIGIMWRITPRGPRINEIVPGGPADGHEGLEVGDLALGVEGGASFQGISGPELAQHVRGPAGTTVRLVFEKATTGERVVHEMTRGPNPPNPAARRAQLDRMIAQSPRDPSAWMTRASERGRFGEWRGALDDLLKVIELTPNESIPWLYAAPLFLALGDEAGHRRHAQAMVRQFAGDQRPEALERTAKVCSLRPPPPAEVPALVELAQKALRLDPHEGFTHWYQLARGMTAYRAGDHQATIELMTRVADAATGHCRDAALLYRAMAGHHLRQSERARADFEEASADLAPAAEKKDHENGWPDWLIADLARQEAEALIARPKDER